MKKLVIFALGVGATFLVYQYSRFNWEANTITLGAEKQDLIFTATPGGEDGNLKNKGNSLEKNKAPTEHEEKVEILESSAQKAKLEKKSFEIEFLTKDSFLSLANRQIKDFQPARAYQLRWEEFNELLPSGYHGRKFRSVKKISGDYFAVIALALYHLRYRSLLSTISFGIKELRCQNFIHFHSSEESPWSYSPADRSLIMTGVKCVSSERAVECAIKLSPIEGTENIGSQLYCRLNESSYSFLNASLLAPDPQL